MRAGSCGLMVMGVALATMALAVEGAAQGTARSMDIDVSIRSAAMGSASNALFRSGELNHWANPALLGYAEGIRYERGRTQLVPGLAPDVWFTTTVAKAGAGGLGVVVGGSPLDPHGVDLDYGVSQGTDENGNPTATFGGFEHVDSWGFGLNLLQAVDQLQRLGGERELGWSRWADISVGMNFKRVEMQLAPPPGGRGTTHARDLGLLVRVTPLDRLGATTGLPVRLDLAWGGSILSHNDDARIAFINEDQAVPVTRHHRNGFSAGLAAGLPGVSPERVDSRLGRVLLRGVWPIVAINATLDRASLGAGDAIDYKTSGRGVELVFANVFAIRRGHYEDKTGDIDGTTTGWSVRIPIGDLAGFEREEATVPQARNSDLESVHRRAYAVWVNPFAIARALRGESTDDGDERGVQARNAESRGERGASESRARAR